MAGWAGFSEDELRKLKHQQQRGLSHPQKQVYCPPEAFLSQPQPLVKNSAQHTPGKNSLQGQTQKKATKDLGKATNSDRAASKPKMVQNAAPIPISPQSQNLPEASIAENKASKSEPQNVTKEEPDEQLLKMEVELKEKSRLDHLQLEQRLMEEKNKRKKALLTKAISEKSRKTQAEALKLQRIQKQLQALDDLVSTDIGILRTRIEHACLEFSQARKRYDRAESEFVVAKLDLHKKTHIKEQLTEHLCTIIQQNELRKAKRLEELMQQLEMETDEEGLELEIEIEHMLQRQESEARKQSLESAAEKSPNPSNIKETVEKEKMSSTIQETCIEEQDEKIIEEKDEKIIEGKDEKIIEGKDEKIIEGKDEKIMNKKTDPKELNSSNTEQELIAAREHSTHLPQELGS